MSDHHTKDISEVRYERPSGRIAEGVPSETDRPAIEVENLRHVYGNRQALAGVTFTVSRGEIFGLLGPNGGGKTTVFKILSTLLLPTGGRAQIFDLDVVRESHRVRRCIGVVFQSPSLDKKLTVVENLRHQGHLYGLRGRTLSHRIHELLTPMGLADRARELVETLSGGLQRRVELAKGLLHRPHLLLLDEPSTGLDPGARRDFWGHLQALRRQAGVTILLTTHLMEEAEGCDRLGILDRGRLVALGSPNALKEKIGGDVITVQTQEPEKLRDQIREKFGGEPKVLDGTVRIERPKGHEFIPQLVEAFPGQIEAITLGKPTLEDVFIQQTGHRFWGDNLAS